jgi:hypothetical protein
MGMFRLLGLFAIIPTTVLLTISFFVLFTLRKTEAGGLKVFGYVISALLWCGALLVFSLGIYTISTGRCIMQEMMQCKMQGMMGEHMPKMMPMQK